MKKKVLFTLLCIVVLSAACSKSLFLNNGESIYKTGKNLQGEKLLDKKSSSIKLFNSCASCHGKNGDAMKKVSIKFSDLSNPNRIAIPYTDSLFYRFITADLKSNGHKANTGVRWKMSKHDSADLLAYLKTL